MRDYPSKSPLSVITTVTSLVHNIAILGGPYKIFIIEILKDVPR